MAYTEFFAGSLLSVGEISNDGIYVYHRGFKAKKHSKSERILNKTQVIYLFFARKKYEDNVGGTLLDSW